MKELSGVTEMFDFIGPGLEFPWTFTFVKIYKIIH